MQDNIFKNLREYYQPTVLFQAHVDLILEPIHELHKLYYDNVLESKQFIYQKGYELAELEVLGKIQEHVSMKSDTSPIFHPENLSSLLEKDQLFGTSKSAAAKLEKDTFNASQKTLTRVDKDINNILVDSYQEGVDYKEVGRRLTKKFNQLKTFEAERIARTETHSAHELGTMQAFEDLDVEYLQWDAHLDNRVRETHEEINGEIIPLGGTFSNGLKYPGDKNGPIKEWINCRCHGVPYILPPGAIAPNMSYFRESDLIYVNQPKLEINKAVNTIENKVINLTPLSNLKDKIKSKLNGNPTTLEQTAKYFGLEYYGLEKQHPWSGNRGKYHKFYDKENDCTFYISENICKGRNKCISLNNDGSSYYDLKEVLQMYNDAPLIMKQKTTSISFVNRNNGNALGRHMSYKKFSEEEWNSLKDIMGKQDDYVEIFRCCLQVPKNAPDNLQTSLYHEMGHSVDLSKNGGVNLSSNPRYKSAVDKEGFSSWYSEDHFTKIKNKYHKKDLREDVAETISIVSFKNINKDNAKIKLSDGSILTYDEFIVKYPEKVKLAEEALGI